MEEIIEKLQSAQIHAGMLVLGIVVVMLWIGKRIQANNNNQDDDES